MRGQHFANFVNRFCQRVAEFFILKVNAHCTNNVLPEVFPAFFVNRFVANNGKFVGSRRYENEHRIALESFVHSEALKPSPCNDQRISIQFAALNEDANLARSF